MPLFRLLGFQQLDCGCLVAQYHKATVDRDVSCVENKGPACRCADHQLNHLIPASPLTSPTAPLAASHPA